MGKYSDARMKGTFWTPKLEPNWANMMQRSGTQPYGVDSGTVSSLPSDFTVASLDSKFSCIQLVDIKTKSFKARLSEHGHEVINMRAGESCS